VVHVSAASSPPERSPSEQAPSERRSRRTQVRDLALAAGLPVVLTLLVIGPSRQDDSVRPTAAYLVVVVAATAVSGLRAGVLSWVVSTVLLWFVVLGPKHDVVLGDANDAISMLVFMVTTAIAVVVVNRLRDDRRHAREELHLRRQAEVEVHAAADRASLLRRLAERMSAETGVDAVAQAVVEQCRAGLGANGAAAFLFDASTDELVMKASEGYSPGTTALWARIAISDQAPVTYAVRERRAIFVQSSEELRELLSGSDVVPDEQFRARCAIPLVRTNGELLGAVLLSWEQARGFDEADRTLIDTIGALCGSSLERAVLGAEREQSRFASALEAMIDPVGIFAAVRDEDGAIVDFRVEYVNDAQHASDVYPTGFAPPVGKTFTELFASAAARGRLSTYVDVVETRRPARLTGVQIQAEPDAEVRSYDIHVSPFGDGVIVATRDVTERERAVRELAESDARLRAAQRVGRVGSWETDLATGETVWSEELYRMFGASTDEDTEEVMLRTIGADAERLRGLVSHVIETGVPMDTEYDVTLDDGRRRRFRARAVLHESVMGGIVRGVVQDITDERELQAAVSTLRSDLRSERAAVEVLQRALLPQDLPAPAYAHVHATYRPAGSHSLVGGDWYDAFLLPSGRLGFTVGDVAGHGIGAASSMSELRHALRAYARTAVRPAEVLGALDSMFTASGDEPYATCFYAVCEVDGSRLTWSNAGHLPMLLLRDGRATPVPTTPGAPLGAGLGRYTDDTLDLRPGDTLLVYTDGLVEQRGEPIDQSIRSLCDAAEALPPLPARDVCERLTSIMLSRSAHDDDVCVLAVEVLAG
jgi:serine phosphatase RsbU (regulator of sigma subunit)/PAS domain-containing protein